jgi:hypothetical protein
MRLRDYLTTHSLTNVEFGSKVELTGEAVRRYANGDRIPSREAMRRIFDETKGAVTPNDFFDISGLSEAVPAEAAAA